MKIYIIFTDVVNDVNDITYSRKSGHTIFMTWRFPLDVIW